MGSGKKFFHNAISEAAEMNGRCTEASYSYAATKGTCKAPNFSVELAQGSVTGYKGVSTVGERTLMSAVALQQVSIAIETYQSLFQSHRGAIYAMGV